MFILLLGLLFSPNPSAQAMPAQVVIIRHGEKPAAGDDLSPKGQYRAQQLVEYLSSNELITKNGRIHAIYSTAPSHQGGSHLSIETVKPFSEASNVAIEHDYDKDQEDDLVKEIMQDRSNGGKTVLICFLHGGIPEIAKDFGIANPPHWEDSVYDRTWIIDLQKSTPQLMVIA